MDHLLVGLTLKDRRALVVGGGEAAVRKLRLLRKTNAAITVLASEPSDEIAGLAAADAVELLRRDFAPGDLAGQSVVFAASGDAALDAAVSRAARAADIPVNVPDRPDLSSFIMPALIDRDPVVVGVTSGGAAPLLARRVRAEIESMLPSRLGRLARFAAGFRDAVRMNLPEGLPRLRFWERFFDGPVAGAVLHGNERAAREAMLSLVNRRSAELPTEGSVHIVGAGPGDPDLLTLRAMRLLQQADVLIHDRLIGPNILDYARRDAERVYVGKAKSDHVRTQTEINALMAEHARAGRRVVRLKGGDPFIFGRGGEEADYLRRRGIAVEVVPGITAATGCAAMAGIPLTHRDFASAVTFVTGHAADDGDEPDWGALVAARQTLVVYMGLSAADAIAARLVEHGMDPATPAAIVEKGTLPDQRTVLGHLADLPGMVARNGLAGPALIILGDVVRLADAAAPQDTARSIVNAR